MTPSDLVAMHLADPRSSWSVGEMGVLAEFHHHGETAFDAAAGVVRTRGGALRIALPGNARVLAYETPSANARLWNHGVAFCVPETEAAMGRRTVITELGVDSEAIDDADREAILFDLGLGMRTTDFCVRTADRELIARLRALASRSWFADPAINAAIVAASPARVVVSRLARVEITNPIPPPDGVSPEGPHTHLLPDILRHHRVFDANIPVPAGWLPCLTLYPPHAARDAEGRERPFDAGAHAAFQTLLAFHGDAEFLAAKRGDGKATRAARLGCLIARRQAALLDKGAEAARE